MKEEEPLTELQKQQARYEEYWEPKPALNPVDDVEFDFVQNILYGGIALMLFIGFMWLVAISGITGGGMGN